MFLAFYHFTRSDNNVLRAISFQRNEEVGRKRSVESSHHGGGKCKFPSWLTLHRTWHTLDHSRSYHVKGHNSTLIVTHKGEGDIRIHCQKMFTPMNEDYSLLAAHVTKGCKSGYYCMLFHRRTSHVIELQESGNATYMEEDACHSRHFKKDVSPFTTLITDTPMLQKCPNMGRRYSITGGLESENVLASVNGQTGNTIISTVTDSSRCQDRDSHMLMSVGCQKPETMEIHSECSTEKYSEFNCHGDWLENRTRYVITSPVSRKSGDASRLCFVLYNSADEGAGLQVATVKETCHRNVTMLGSDNTYYSMFNMTAHGVCSDSGSSVVLSYWSQLILVPIFLTGQYAR
ncbi:hypothetical protein M8J75_016379 [Diaphorina citri]|nr:hypothetical protein M8J75_016379 [Diaphorina citri]